MQFPSRRTFLVLLIAGFILACDINIDEPVAYAKAVSLSAPPKWPAGDTLRVDFTYVTSLCYKNDFDNRLSDSQLVIEIRERYIRSDTVRDCAEFNRSDAVLVPPPRAAVFRIYFGPLSATVAAQ